MMDFVMVDFVLKCYQWWNHTIKWWIHTIKWCILYWKRWLLYTKKQLRTSRKRMYPTLGAVLYIKWRSAVETRNLQWKMEVLLLINDEFGATRWVQQWPGATCGLLLALLRGQVVSAFEKLSSNNLLIQKVCLAGSVAFQQGIQFCIKNDAFCIKW